MYYDEDDDDNDTQKIHFHIEFLTEYKKKRKIEIIVPENKEKNELQFKLIGINNIIKTEKKGISFYIKIRNITKPLKGINDIKVIIDDFACAKLYGQIRDLPQYAYNKEKKKIEIVNKKKILNLIQTF